MDIPGNLISDSPLVQETLDLVVHRGGRATFIEIAELVFRLMHTSNELAALLVSDLVHNDSRFRVEPEHLAIADDSPEFRSLPEIDFVVLDVEAIAPRSAPAKIIDLGAYHVRGGEITTNFQTLINPETILPRFIASLTGITDDMLLKAPKFSEIVRPWLDFAGDAVLVAHNSNFDLPLLNREIERVFPGQKMRNPELCTVDLARRLLRQRGGHNLDALADHFGFEINGRHRAAGDAQATARLLLHLLDQLEISGVRTLAEARRFRADVVSPNQPDLLLALDV